MFVFSQNAYISTLKMMIIERFASHSLYPENKKKEKEGNLFNRSL